MRQASVALITCLERSEPDPDEELLLAAVRAAGLRAEWVAWDDPQREASDFDLCVLRTCWNYYEDPHAFRSWIEHTAAATVLLNPRDAVLWNMHKRYLGELEAAGLPVIPTAWVERGEKPDLRRILAERNWSEIVVKPCISASSYGTRRFAAEDEDRAQTFAEELARERDVMLQPAMPGFEHPGERALMWIDGELTHAITKTARFAGETEAVSKASVVSVEERHFCERVLSLAPPALLYARIDVVRDLECSDQLVLSELELMEPSLYFAQHPPALQRFAAALARQGST